VDEGALQGLRGTWRVPWSMGKVRAGMQREQNGGWGHWGVGAGGWGQVDADGGLFQNSRGLFVRDRRRGCDPRLLISGSVE
jgi:hypothetical protein